MPDGCADRDRARLDPVRWSAAAARILPLVVLLAGAVALMHSLAGMEEHGGGGHAATAMTVASVTEMHCCSDGLAEGPASAGPEMPDGSRVPGHGVSDWTHLCLAVLTALAATLLLRSHLRPPDERREETAAGPPRIGPLLTRAPPLAGRVLLNSVCVLRV